MELFSKLKKKIKDSIPRNLLIKNLNKNAPNHILLTFDDGPDPEITPKVLEILKKYNVKAVFFIPGRRIKKAPELLKKIVEDGHIIGNHTFSHHNSPKQPSFFLYLKDIIKCQKKIKTIIAENPVLFRPPLGIISFTTLFAPKILGLKTINWSLDSNDWKCKTPNDAVNASEKILNEVVAGDIILLHDDNQYVLETLENVLPVLKERNIDLALSYEFL